MAAIDVNIDNTDDIWECYHNYLNDQNNASALLSGVIGALLIPSYLGRYKESQRRLQDISIRQQNVALCLKDHYINKTQPQILKSLNMALEMEIPDTDVDCSEYDDKSKAIVQSAKDWGARYAMRYNVCAEFGCDNELDAYGAMGAVDTAYARQQFNRRRQERRRQLKRGIIQKAHGASNQNPSEMFNLFNTATQIYGQLYQNSQTQLAGAFQSFGGGLGAAGGFFGN